ncbi:MULTISPECIES: alpha-amylase family glycosyl hydrolase [unclassified Corallococcus]|uniref:alpha-amylase family glycosyl hydrolase n=1 Tax=unclassified Corallococcus TaxID=2685029 RepID=UPI001A8D6E81|nr:MULTISPECIES: alpha-amylase family glycosyl hydrolase [unclassified Corallococcus]MBN9683439.1 glycosidase [Corallococcus sp. NCSPR001]WAS85043.1 alpha-amylase family glycosyl hydrolase [Corallococcus sp. NCRR]
MHWRKSLLTLAMAGVLAACHDGNSGSDGGTQPPPPVDAGEDAGVEDGGVDAGVDAGTPYTATVDTAAARADSRLACFKGNGEPACGLRLYQVMVEAFVDADSTADYNTGYGTSHHKGDLLGIINSLDAIKSTGVNALWLTPVFASVPVNGQDDWASRLDATGYFASDYFNVDPKFGTNARLQELVDGAHARGMYVFLDGVFGHYKVNASDYPSPQGRKLSTTGQQGGTGRSAVYPDDLEFFKEVAAHWVTTYKVDGWRLDQAAQVPVQYWDDLRTAVAQAAADVSYTNAAGQSVHPLGYMVAEIWSGPADIASNGYGPAASPALLSAFDFPVRYSLVQTLAVEESGTGNRGANNLQAGYQNQLAYPAHAMPNLMLTNHDLVRFGDLLQRGGLAQPEDNSWWARHKAAFSFMAGYSGPITLYYGDEVGQELPGFAAKEDNATCAVRGLCDDHVSRTSAIVDGIPTTVGAPATVLTPAQADLKLYVSSLWALRDAHPALANGSRTHIYSDDTVYIDRKDTGSDHVLYVLNVKATPAVITVAGTAIGSAGALVGLMGGEDVALVDGHHDIALRPFEGRFFVIASPTAEGPQTGPGGGLSGQGPLARCDAPTVDGLGPLGKELFIRGSYVGGDNFGATPANRRFAYKGDNIYQVVVNEPDVTAYTFKFASADWSTELAVLGGNPVVIASEQPMALAAGPGKESSLAIPEAGDYVFSFRINASNNGGELMVSKCP